MKRILLVLLTTYCFTTTSTAQNVGIGTNSPKDYSKLDIQSTSSGFNLPSMTTIQRNALKTNIEALSAIISSSYSGMMVYDITDNTMYMWDASKSTNGDWNNMLDADASVDDADADPNNEIQDLSSSASGTNRTLNISGGSGTTINVADNDNNSSNEIQNLSISGSTITLNNGGGSVTIPSSADNLGNHSATTDLDMNDNIIDDISRIGVGVSNPFSKVQISNSEAITSLNVLSTTNSIVSRTVNIERTENPSTDNDILQIATPGTSPDDFQFVEFDRGGTVEFAVDGDGDIEFSGALEPNGLPGTSGQFLRTNGINASPTWVTIPGFNGDITGVAAGDGLTGGATSGNAIINVVATNGLIDNANDVRLGGTLVQATTITQGVNNMTYNLDGTGDFNIQDNGTNRFQVLDNGRVEMSGTTDASGTANSGVLEIGNSLRLDGNEIITNTNSILYLNNDNNGDLRVDASTLVVDASENRVGIGTTTPGGKIQVNNTDGSYMLYNTSGNLSVYNAETYTGEVRLGAAWNRPGVYSSQQLELFSDATGVIFGDSNVERMRLTAAGRLGIAENTPLSDLHIQQSGGAASAQGTGGLNLENGAYHWRMYNSNNYVRFNYSADGGATYTAKAYILPTDGSWNQVSDESLKNNVTPLNSVLDNVLKLKPVDYYYNDNTENDSKSIGFLAQEAQKLFPNTVSHEKGASLLGINYSSYAVISIKAIQEQQEIIEGLQKQIDDLKKLIK